MLKMILRHISAVCPTNNSGGFIRMARMCSKWQNRLRCFTTVLVTRRNLIETVVTLPLLLVTLTALLKLYCMKLVRSELALLWSPRILPPLQLYFMDLKTLQPKSGKIWLRFLLCLKLFIGTFKKTKKLKFLIASGKTICNGHLSAGHSSIR